jgi:hypothetical protein
VAGWPLTVMHPSSCSPKFHPPGMPTPIFEAQMRALSEELHGLRSLVHARTACRRTMLHSR